ncbi:MAG: hypothetical protein QOJ27_2096, partial [Sphingomonadales bacterium]|nr:hypothetical protein [Sphingomonadales bacterium]
ILLVGVEIRKAWTAALMMAAAACGPGEPDRVVADRYDSFWLWGGVRAQPALQRARTLYLLDGEIRAREPGRYAALRPGAPRLAGKSVWLVVRTDTLDWPDESAAVLAGRLDRWAAAGNKVTGLQVDFDARTHGLAHYAAFLRALRRQLPSRYRLSVTGLMDWSANGDPTALAALQGVVDEVVVQTYQGRETIPGYEAWFARMRGFRLPFKVGLVQGGRWRPPAGLAAEPNFRGYVVFLVNPPRGAGSSRRERPAFTPPGSLPIGLP